MASIRHGNVTASLLLRKLGRPFGDALLQHIAPVHWNHINLTGDYSWRQNKRAEIRRPAAAQDTEGLTYFILPFAKSPRYAPHLRGA